MSETYEYAGFLYKVEPSDRGPVLSPLEGQHPAAAKQKHVMAARECYLDDRSRRNRRG